VRSSSAQGFTLVELLLALSVGTLMFGMVLRLMAGDLRLGSAMALHWREKARQRLSLELVREEVALGFGVVADPPESDRWACAMAGRRPVLAIALDPADPQAREQAIVYSIGPAPSPIWRGHVLMRCGPAYGLDGLPNRNAAFQNRVLLDALAVEPHGGFQAVAHHSLPVLQLQIEQVLPGASGGERRLQTRAAV